MCEIVEKCQVSQGIRAISLIIRLLFLKESAAAKSPSVANVTN